MVIRGHAVSLLRVVSHLRSGLDGMDLLLPTLRTLLQRVYRNWSLIASLRSTKRETKENSARRYCEPNQTKPVPDPISVTKNGGLRLSGRLGRFVAS